MKRVELLNIDTFNCRYNVSNQYQTYSLDTASIKTAPNAYNITVPLSFRRSNVRRISLKSLEMPVAFPSVRQTSNLNLLLLADTINFSSPKAIVLADKNYTSVAALIADINTAFTATWPTLLLTMSLDATTGNIKITSTNATAFPGSIYVKAGNLAYMLGFRSGIDSQGSRSVTASSSYRLSIDDYVNIYLPQFNSNCVNTNNVNCSFKVPLNTTNGVVYYRNDMNPFFINVASGYHFSEITVLITDRFGYSLNSWGQDVSLTLELEY